MRRLLEIAERVCGARACHSVFEPLVADWQRELTQARQTGRAAYAWALVSGTLAFLRSTVSCLCADGAWRPPVRTVAVGLPTLVIAMLLPLGMPLAVRALTGTPLDLGSARTLSSMALYSNLYFPPAALLALFLIHRDQRLSRRHALLAVFSIAVVGAGLMLTTSNDAVRRYFSTPEWLEREYQRAIANDRAGRLQYPGTAVREAKTQTFEQRRISYQRFAEMTEARTSEPASWGRSARQLQPVALAIVLSVMGWRLATLARPTFGRAMLWWLLMLGFTMTTARWPQEATLALVCLFTALLFVSMRQRQEASSAAEG